jgi:hypothetical protein
MKILHLTLKREYFDMIDSGFKPEEYREIKLHWVRQLIEFDFKEWYFETAHEKKMSMKNAAHDFIFDLQNNHSINDCFKSYKASYKKFDAVEFRNGYRPDSRKMTFKIRDILIDQGFLKWGASMGEEYFVIKLGEKL